MNCTGGQLLVTSNILSLSQSHCIPCVMFSLSMARNMNCALRLLSPPVPKLGTSDPSNARVSSANWGNLWLWWYYTTVICMVLQVSGTNPVVLQEPTKAWCSIQIDSFRKFIVLPLPHKDIFLNGKITREVEKTIQNLKIYLCTWTLHHSLWWNFHKNLKMWTSCHPSHTHPSHFLMLRQSLQTEILDSGNSQSAKSLNCKNYFTLVPLNLCFTRSAGPVLWALTHVSHSECFLGNNLSQRAQRWNFLDSTARFGKTLHCHCSSLASLSLQ